MGPKLGALVASTLVFAACSSSKTAEPTVVTAPLPATTSPATVAPSPATTAAAATSPAVTVAAASRYTATIRRTTDGVPHIAGATMDDAVFGEGYASATDHACTLADALLTPLGKRAETFGAGTGNANVESDFAWRHIGIDTIARADYAAQPDGVRALMESFAAGWNQYLADVGSAGLHGWCAGKAWVQPITAENLYVYARSVSLLASSGALTQYISSALPPAPASSAPTTILPVNGFAPAAGSNGWAVGKDRVTGGKGSMLIANPHFPWEGSLRFWEVQLTVPGTMNIYGVQLIGLPGVGIGFTDTFAWTHTVSAGHRFTAYTLDLDPADPTRYLVDGTSTAMKPQDIEVRVLQADGTTTTERRTLWSSEYGPIINFPGFGWTAQKVITFRDANIDNDQFIQQYLAMDTAKSFDQFVAAHREHQGVPLFNTIAVSADGRAWYADTSATPKLSAEAEALYAQSVQNDPVVKIAADSGAVLLNGSDSRFRWQDVPGARSPGLVPFDEMPMVERSDYVFNANDSFWMPHATALLAGNYSAMHGGQRTERSLRTRENALVLSSTGADTPSGVDGTFTAEELRAAALYDQASSATLLRQPVVERCTGAAPVEVPALTGSDGTEALPAGTVDLAAACQVLAAWDGFYNLDSRGAVLWHEFLSAARRDAPGGLGALWAVPFDPADPLNTPRDLAPAAAGAPDVVLQSLARGVQALAKAGRAVDVPLGEVQYALRDTPRIGLHGGPGPDGLTNVIDYGNTSDTSEVMTDPGPRLVPGSDLRAGGYPIDRGTSFLMNVDFSSGHPEGWTILTYGETGDRTSPLFNVQTRRFSGKDWRRVAYTDSEIAANPDLTTKTVSGG